MATYDYKIITERPSFVTFDSCVVPGLDGAQIVIVSEETAQAIQNHIAKNGEILSYEEMQMLHVRGSFEDFARCYLRAMPAGRARSVYKAVCNPKGKKDWRNCEPNYKNELENILLNAPEIIAGIIRARFNMEECKICYDILHSKNSNMHVLFGIIDLSVLYEKYDQRQKEIINHALKTPGGQTLYRAFIHGARREIAARFREMGETEGEKEKLAEASRKIMVMADPLANKDGMTLDNITRLILTWSDCIAQYDPSFPDMTQSEIDNYLLLAFSGKDADGNYTERFALREVIRSIYNPAGTPSLLSTEMLKRAVQWAKTSGIILSNMPNCLTAEEATATPDQQELTETASMLPASSPQPSGKIKQHPICRIPYGTSAWRGCSKAQRKTGFCVIENGKTKEYTFQLGGKKSLIFSMGSIFPRKIFLSRFDLSVENALSIAYSKYNLEYVTFEQIYCIMNGTKGSKQISESSINDIRESIEKLNGVTATITYKDSHGATQWEDGRILDVFCGSNYITITNSKTGKVTSRPGCHINRIGTLTSVEERLNSLLTLTRDQLNLSLSGISVTKTAINIREYLIQEVFRIQNTGETADRYQTITLDAIIKDEAHPELVVFDADGMPKTTHRGDSTTRILRVAKSREEQQKISQMRHDRKELVKKILEHFKQTGFIIDCRPAAQKETAFIIDVEKTANAKREIKRAIDIDNAIEAKKRGQKNNKK